MSELTDLEARLHAKFASLEAAVVSWRWYALVALAALVAGFVVGHLK